MNAKQALVLSMYCENHRNEEFEYLDIELDKTYNGIYRSCKRGYTSYSHSFSSEVMETRTSLYIHNRLVADGFRVTTNMNNSTLFINWDKAMPS